jgi:transcriptional regulator with XRE-family HTH domain
MDTLRLGRSFAAARRAAGLTQAQVACQAGTTQPVISRLESGRVVPALDLLDRVAAAIGSPVTLTLGVPATIGRDERARRVALLLGEAPFDPWEREPTPAETDSLRADGIRARS